MWLYSPGRTDKKERSKVDFTEFRRNMVEGQLLPEGVSARHVLDAFLDTPRELFVPRQQQHIAYMDDDFSVGYNRFALRPATLAKMLQALNPQPHEKAMVVGCNLGFTVAVLSHMVHFVVGIETTEILSRQAEKTLHDFGIRNFEIIKGDHAQGYPEHGPYDLILVEGKVKVDVQPLLDQLKDSGRLAAISSSRSRADKVILYTKMNGHISERIICDATSPSLLGFEKPQQFEF